MGNVGLNEAQSGIKIAGRNINNLRYADDTTLMEESKEELKSLLMKVKEENETASPRNDCYMLIPKRVLPSKANIWPLIYKTLGIIFQFMANRWGNNGNNDRLYFLGLQKSLQMVIAVMKLKDACFLEEKL